MSMTYLDLVFKNKNILFAEKATPKLSGCSGSIFVTNGQLLECPITVDLNVRVEILVNGIRAGLATNKMVQLPILSTAPVDVK